MKTAINSSIHETGNTALLIRWAIMKSLDTMGEDQIREICAILSIDTTQ